MAEQLLTKPVHLAAPLALKERRTHQGWEHAVYYLRLKSGRMIVLRLTDDGQALGVFYFDKDTLQANTPSIGQSIMALTMGNTLSLNNVGPQAASINCPKIEAVFVCSRELRTAAEANRLYAYKKEAPPRLTMHDELTKRTLMEAPGGTCFYVTLQGKVFRCTLHDLRIKLEEMYVKANTPPRVMFLDQGSGPSKQRASRRQNLGANWKGTIGPFDRIFSSDKPMTPNEIRAHFKIAGRHKPQPR